MGKIFDYEQPNIKNLILIAKTLKIESLDKEIIKVISFKEFEEMNKK